MKIKKTPTDENNPIVGQLLTPEEMSAVAGGGGDCDAPGGGDYSQNGGTFNQNGGNYDQGGGNYNMTCPTDDPASILS